VDPPWCSLDLPAGSDLHLVSLPLLDQPQCRSNLLRRRPSVLLVSQRRPSLQGEEIHDHPHGEADRSRRQPEHGCEVNGGGADFEPVQQVGEVESHTRLLSPTATSSCKSSQSLPPAPRLHMQSFMVCAVIVPTSRLPAEHLPTTCDGGGAAWPPQPWPPRWACAGGRDGGGTAVASICVTGMERPLEIEVLRSIPIVVCTMQSGEWVPLRLEIA
jgi:hypothetical protein